STGYFKQTHFFRFFVPHLLKGELICPLKPVAVDPSSKLDNDTDSARMKYEVEKIDLGTDSDVAVDTPNGRSTRIAQPFELTENASYLAPRSTDYMDRFANRKVLPVITQNPQSPSFPNRTWKVDGFGRNLFRSSWQFRTRSSQASETFGIFFFQQIDYLPIENIRMESIADKIQYKVQRGLREGCIAIGILFSTITLILVELVRMLAYTVIRPVFHLVRFIVHLFTNLFCDVCYLCSLRCKRCCLPLVDLCAVHSQEVVVPVIRHFHPYRCSCAARLPDTPTTQTTAVV
ncbi:hypothetical protein PHET_00088, partial [Paragonimus heterotremus]